MLSEILSRVAEWVTHVVSTAGYAGVFSLLFVDAMNIPLPSEVSLGFAGYLVSTGRFEFVWAVLVGTIGYTAGAALSYWIGRKGGRHIVERYGKFLLISKRDLARADRLFNKYGNAIAFFSRMLPVLRTFISLPAGVFKVPFAKYIAYTFVGSLLWSILFVYLGQLVGENYEILSEKMHGLEYVVLGVILLGAVWWVVHFVREQREIRRELAASAGSSGPVKERS